MLQSWATPQISKLYKDFWAHSPAWRGLFRSLSNGTISPILKKKKKKKDKVLRKIIKFPHQAVGILYNFFFFFYLQDLRAVFIPHHQHTSNTDARSFWFATIYQNTIYTSVTSEKTPWYLFFIQMWTFFFLDIK